MNIPDEIELCKPCCLQRDRYEIVYRMSTGLYYCGGCGAHEPGEKYVLRVQATNVLAMADGPRK